MKTRLKEFGYINQIIGEVYKGLPFPIDEVIEIGTRKSAKTSAWETASRDLMLIGDSVGGIDLHWLRYNVGDANELFEDIVEEFEEVSASLVNHINKSKRTITYQGNKLRVHGLHTQSKKGKISDNKVGLAKGKKKYAIILLEEAHQIPFKEKQAFLEAMRGYEHLLIVSLSNPWSVYNELIQYANERLGFNEGELTTGKCDQYKVMEEDGIKKLFHYSNWRNNPYLQEWERTNLENLLRLDPIRARVSVNGMPGLESGAIYSPYLHNVIDINKLSGHHFIFEESRQYIGGVDWGVVNDSAVIQLWAYGESEDWVAGLKRHGHNNKPDHRDFNGYKNNIDLEVWVVKSCEEWALEYKDIRRKGLSVGVEQAELAVIDHLNAIATKKGLSWLEFYPAPKPPIADRIVHTTATMAVGRFFLDYNEFEVLLEELNMSSWEEVETNSLRKAEKKRVDLNDHDINTMEYAIDSIMYNIDEQYAEALLSKGMY